ncbi:ankyrin 2,3/unc44 [Ectocarpus siliculosus]|uniref:Ankyrin 2,3/unc44 n=1 Tax=Ectocarpus siliculosus TaxID=2880 RepID=D8LTK9_ECTSI|nr:ankyrin 2,3/unc44 [Ectocarpus siliculosus]|eukprot:CBN73906.1 ankyrin 2,3/unc44 [Ectocarpus siliculosus]
MLLDAGAKPDAVDGDGNTPLLTAAKTGAAVLCEILLARGADPRARNKSGSNALLLAVDGDNSAENSACVQVLLDAGSDPHETGPDGTVALHVSAHKGQTEVLWSLLQHGARVDVADVSGLTPLAYAVSNDHGDATGLLCDYGANLDLVDAAGRTALHVASQDGKVNALAELLGRSVNVDAKDAMGETALHYAAYSGKVEAVRALLETGADPSLQSLRGDNAAHIASRAGYVEIVRALVEYDVRIGQRNWQEYTPFGEARMNNHSQVAEFLSGSFVRLGGKGPSLGGNNGASTTIAELDDAQQQQQGGNEARGWDKEMEDKVQGWETEWDQDKQRFYYVNAETGETSYTAPFKISADRVEELREGAEVEYLRKVAPVNGESLLGLSDYREAFQEEKTELDTHKLRHQAAVVIQSCWRARMARIEANRRRKERRCASVINRQMRRFLGRCRRKRLGQVMSACLMLQKIVRGCMARRRHREGEAEMKRLRDANTLNRLVTRVYRGHLYGRRPARQLRAQREASWWGPSEWEAARHDAGDPLRTFFGWTGQWEAYLLQGSVDVMFYRNAASAEYTWDLPEEWQSQDAFDFYQREHTRIHGFTAEEAEAATLLQKAWRGKTSRNHFNLLMRAQKICKGAEAAYLADPDNLRSQINYILFTHVIDKDYNRSRILYTTALAAMEQRGPDVQLLLFAFAIFCFVTREEDFVSILATVERAIEAGAARDDADGIGRRWPPESYTSRRNPKRFALAEAGFFRFAAYNTNDAESWHNYAACRQLAYGDYAGASECYLKAIEKNPKDPKLQANYQTLMDTFPEHSQGSSTFESLSTHHQSQAENDKRRQDTASAKFLQRPEVKQAVIKIERAYLRSRQRQIDRFGTYLGPTGMLLREVQGEALAHQREHTASSPSSNNRGRQHDQRQQSVPPLPALSNSSSPGREPRGPLLLLPRAAGSALSGDDGRSQGSSASARVHQGVERPYMTGSDTSRKESGPMVPALSGPSSDYPSRSLGLVPPGWDIAEDDAGNKYYFNAAAAGRDFSTQAAAVAGDAAHGQLSGGETVHTRRYSEIAESSHGTEKEEGGELPAFPAGDAENATTDAGLAEHVGGSEPPLPLPDGWEAVDVGDGSIYYHHVLSGLTQWEVPREEEPHEITTAMAATPPDGSPWEEFKTEEGVPFWYNSSTGESSWSPPGHPAGR